MEQNNLIERLKYLKKMLRHNLLFLFLKCTIFFTSFENVTLKFIQGVSKMWVLLKDFFFYFNQWVLLWCPQNRTEMIFVQHGVFI